MKHRKEAKALGKKVKMIYDNLLMVNDEYYGVKKALYAVSHLKTNLLEN